MLSRIGLLILFSTAVMSLRAQLLTSTCDTNATTPDSILREDAARLAHENIYQLQSPDTSNLILPSNTTTQIFNGLVAIHNLTNFPPRDTVFNQLNIHCPTPNVHRLAVFTTTNTSLFQSWSNGNLYSGNAKMDSLITDLQFNNLRVFNNGGQDTTAIITFESSFFLNSKRLIDSVETIQGIDKARTTRPRFGEYQKAIHYTQTDSAQLFTFIYRWGDCPSGCLYARGWTFAVDENCNVIYKGSQGPELYSWGYNDIPSSTEDNDFNTPKVAPNPFQQSLNIAFSDYPNDAVQVRLFNNQGQLVKKKMSHQKSFSLTTASLSTGIYFLVLQSDNRTFNYRCLKQ